MSVTAASAVVETSVALSGAIKVVDASPLASVITVAWVKRPVVDPPVLLKVTATFCTFMPSVVIAVTISSTSEKPSAGNSTGVSCHSKARMPRGCSSSFTA